MFLATFVHVKDGVTPAHDSAIVHAQCDVAKAVNS